MSNNPFMRGKRKERWWLVFPSGTVGHWPFPSKESAENFATKKIKVVKAPTREAAHE